MNDDASEDPQRLSTGNWVLLSGRSGFLLNFGGSKGPIGPVGAYHLLMESLSCVWELVGGIDSY